MTQASRLSPRFVDRRAATVVAALACACRLLLAHECYAEPATGAAAAPDPSAPSPAAVTEAGQRYDRGLKLYSEGDFRLAVIEFERAHELVPDHRVLYNIGQVRIQLGDYAKARIALERYLKEGAGKIAPAREESVKTDLEMLSGRTATLQVECNVEGAEVSIDGEVVGTTPLPDPILMNAGEHTIEVRKADYQTRSLRHTLAGKDAGDVKVELEKIPSTPPPAAFLAVPEHHAAAQPRSTAPIWAGWITTGALAAGAAVTGIVGLNAANENERLRAQKDLGPNSDLKSSASRANTFLLANDILTGAAVVAGGISLYLTLKSPSSSSDGRDQASVGVRVSPNGIALSGRY